jgi:hypothetical protein
MEQMVARWAHNPKVVGSSPTPVTNKFKLDNMKTTHELLKLLKEHCLSRLTNKSLFLFMRRISTGLCAEIFSMNNVGICSLDECDQLRMYLYKNAPTDVYKSPHYPYWYKRGLWKPRLEWLNKHIKLTEEKL